MSFKLKSKLGILIAIVLAQFLCTSLWFAGNAVVSDFIHLFNFPVTSVGFLTSSIQFGFISGTLAYALLNIADRFSPSKVFFVSALLSVASNYFLIFPAMTVPIAMMSRFLTGLFLAGIYPVGMKIAADHFDKDLGKSLGLLVGALVVGTALPHLIKSYIGNLSYIYVIQFVSVLAIIGAFLILILVPDGPYRKPSMKVELSKTFAAFRNRDFRGAAFGYFGHMWELYAFFTFVPAILFYHINQSPRQIDIFLWSFIIITCGGLGCAISGLLSQRFRPKWIATAALSISGLCCLFSPLFLDGGSTAILLTMLIIWGGTISADSPMFSTLVAQNAIPELKGTALTIVNCIGFALTIFSIQLLTWMADFMEFKYLFLILGIGPLFGLWSLWNNNQESKQNLM